MAHPNENAARSNQNYSPKETRTLASSKFDTIEETGRNRVRGCIIFSAIPTGMTANSAREMPPTTNRRAIKVTQMSFQTSETILTPEEFV